jgi:hypothetical protein
MEWRKENRTEQELQLGYELVNRYKIQGRSILESCSTCHR